MAEFTSVARSEIENYARCDAEFFAPSITGLVEKVRKKGAKPLAHFISSAARGQAPEYRPDGKIPVVRTVNVRELEFSEVRQEYVTEDFFYRAEKGRVARNDIVITSTGVGTLGRSFCNIVGGAYFADGHITVLKPAKDADVSFITAVLQSRMGRLQFERWQRGSSGQIEIYPEDIGNVLIPMMPPQQRKVIAGLWKEAVLSVHKSARLYPEAEEELLERLNWKRLKQSPVEGFFTRKRSEIDKQERIDAEHFQTKYVRLRTGLQRLGAQKLGDIASQIAKGTQPKNYSDNGEIAVVKSKNVFGHGIDFESCERTSREVYEDEDARLSEGDVVMNSTGFGTLGRAAFVPSLSEKAIAAVDLLILRLRTQEAIPEYVTLFLNSKPGLWQSEMHQTGSSGQLHLYPSHVREILIFIPRNATGKPDLRWQKKLAEKVIRANSAKQEARAKLEQAKRMVEEFVVAPET